MEEIESRWGKKVEARTSGWESKKRRFEMAVTHLTTAFNYVGLIQMHSERQCCSC